DYLARSGLGEAGVKHGVAKNAVKGKCGAEVSAHRDGGAGSDGGAGTDGRADAEAARGGNHANISSPAIGAGDAAHSAGVSLRRVEIEYPHAAAVGGHGEEIADRIENDLPHLGVRQIGA